MITIFALICLVALGSTINIFCCKSKNERPIFVVVQILCFDLFCISFVIYFAMIYNNREGLNLHTKLANAIASVGDVGYLMHNWFFAKQYVEASLNLPIIIELFDNDSIE